MLDVSLSNRRERTCDGRSRRDFLRSGGLSALGLSLADVLRLEARAEARIKPRAKSVILVFLGGGLSHHDSFDLKPHADEAIRGKYKPIETNIPGLQIGELLPKMAQSMDQVALVRSGAHNNDHHETATNWVLSGRFGSPFGDYPAIGAVAAHEFGFTDVLPPYVAVPGNPSFTWELGKSAFLGGRYESFKTGDPNAGNFQVRDMAALEQLSNSSSLRRKTLLGAVDGLAKRIEGNDQIRTYDEFRERATTMLTSSQARSAFVLDEEDPLLRDRYGRTTFGQSCLLARRLVERGVRFTTVTYGGWDHHGKIFDNLDKKLPEFDAGLSTLIADLNDRGLTNDTLVAVFGEFGRTPKINKDAGRDHWGGAASLLFFGAGVKTGQVIGATDKEGGTVTKNPIAPADVCYTILESLGINPRVELHTADGRPIEALDSGRFLHELWG
ncbi:MAG TPA: DUF1501 domain-containing protein [Pirellulales bacterium]